MARHQIFPHIPPEQFGFLKGFSTLDPDTSLPSTISTAIIIKQKLDLLPWILRELLIMCGGMVL